MKWMLLIWFVSTWTQFNSLAGWILRQVCLLPLTLDVAILSIVYLIAVKGIGYLYLVFISAPGISVANAGVSDIYSCSRQMAPPSPAATWKQFWLGSFCQHYYLTTVKETDFFYQSFIQVFYWRWWQWSPEALFLQIVKTGSEAGCFHSYSQFKCRGVYSRLVWPIQLRIICELTPKEKIVSREAQNL